MAANRLLLEKGAPGIGVSGLLNRSRPQRCESWAMNRCSSGVRRPEPIGGCRFNAAERRFGRLDILVNCAGYVNLQPATKSRSEW